ncbi:MULTISPECIES: PAQR family membrane homeostasis protein TrhA [Paenibacillus]|uniref:PAQR family membrane homeostasis protein TrhA n=1 Tax=Paenibacillus TaxID=44249 RepID=UPI0022B8CA85|nr:hemolysin III family protein [Paenibacillus caseinilyticus]MCZ8522554.1 hemolysin III family protein [Paenibacillus caseinilyticus]
MDLMRLKEERWNAWTHGIGTLLSAVGLLLLVERAGVYRHAAYTVSSTVYGASFILLYISSTLLHSARSARWIERFERLDHAAIFIAMAGSYTPFLVYAFPGLPGYAMLTLVWGLALTGIGLVRWIIRRFMPWGMIYYLLLGWLIVFLIGPLQSLLPPQGLAWLLAGGILYSTGILFFVWRSLRYHHAVWHLFVLAGSGCHFITVYAYLVPAAPSH